jgi:hypothetical protein
MNPTKLGLHFSDFATIFYGFYNYLQITNTIGVKLVVSPPRFSADSQIGPYFAVVLSPRNVVLWGGGRSGLWNSGEVRRRGRSGMGVGWSRGALGPVWGFGRGNGATGDGARRRRPGPAAVAYRPAMVERARDDTRLCEPG